MADEKIDVNKLIEDAKRQAEEAKAAADAAAKEAAKKSSKNQKENAVKQILLERQKRISANQKNLDNFMFDIKRIAKLIATNKATAGDQKELQRISNLYNELLDVQNKLVTETESISAGTAEVDLKTGEVKTEAKTPAPDTQYKYGVYKGVVNGKEVDVVQTSDLQIFVNQQPYTGSIKFGDKVSQYKNGYLVTEQKKTDKKEKLLPGEKEPAGVVGEPPIKPGEPIKTTAEMAAFRAGERGVTGIATTPTTPVITGANIDEIFKAAASVYGGIDEIFKTDAELRALLTKAVGNLTDPKDDYNVDRFVSELENTKWFKTNAGPIRQRGFYKRQYDQLVNDIKTNDPDYKAKIAELNKTSEFGRGLTSAEETVREYVTQLLGINALDDATIKSIASDIYLYANESDTVKIRNAVLAAAKYGKGGKIGDVTLGGASGENLTSLRSIAAANGFDLDKTFATSLPTWIDNLNKGESIETYKRIIRDAAKTAYNVSDRVAALLDQGVDLDTIYSPYKNTMASVLEINPKEVTLKDLIDKGVISNKDQMNLYDFQRSLRKDSRWQYTGQAREETSNIALQVLRDFGFQG
jgi:hypothetical protein